ncbi:uncharacterized protein LOC135479585 isoform X2 [Liolophura sinensis]|uniref:uncharacterized protein LOC135479585 isoform X2 n=1 Tax=Liolophura sinensis TaxID=3198878 RepID=UPI00315804B6
MLAEDSGVKSEHKTEGNCLCVASQSELPCMLSRSCRSAVSLPLPVVLSTLALVLSTITSVYVALNTGCTPCTISRPGRLSTSLPVSPSADVSQENGAPTRQDGRNNPQFFHEILKRAANKNNGKSGKNRGSDPCRRRCKTKSHRVLASHFVPKGTGDLPFAPGMPCVEYERKTLICRNQTAIQREQNADIMRHFWVMSSTKIKKKPPMELTDGKFVTIKKTGQYLIYSQGTFLESSYRTSLQVTVDGKSVMRCTESSNEQMYDVSYQSCGVSGVFSLSANQKVAVKFPYPGTQIDLKQDATYFGLIYMSK